MLICSSVGRARKSPCDFSRFLPCKVPGFVLRPRGLMLLVEFRIQGVGEGEIASDSRGGGA